MMEETRVVVRDVTDDDWSWLRQWLVEHWGSETVVVHGTVYYPERLPGWVAEAGGEPVGVLTYHIEGGECEIVTIDAAQRGKGIGTALIEVARQQTLAAGCVRLWLITTNDNLDALRFYQRRGFRMAALHANAAEHSRQLKPRIPEVGAYGIPLRDEIELEMVLDG